jgi:predicted DNA binding protein
MLGNIKFVCPTIEIETRNTTLGEVVANLSEIVDVTLEKAGDYHPRMRDPARQLTDRQYEIVRAAITEGYYDLPRQASQRDLAATLELSRGTVAEHLRKAESKIIREVMN